MLAMVCTAPDLAPNADPPATTVGRPATNGGPGPLWWAASASFIVCVALAALTVGWHLVNGPVDLATLWPSQIRLGWLINASSALIFAVAGWYLATRRPGVPYGWLALAAGLGHGLSGVALEYTLAAQTAGRSWPLVAVAATTANWGQLVEQPILMLVYGTYPDGRLPRGWLRWAVIVAVVLPTVATLNVALDPNPGRDADLAAIAGLHNPISLPWATSSPSLIPLFFAPAAWLVMATILHRWWRAEGEARRVLSWIVVVGLTVTVVVPPSVVLLPYGVGAAIGQATTLLEMTVIVAATVRHQVFGIDLVLNRALVLAALSAVVAVVYGVVVASASALGASTGLSSFAAALVAALALAPIGSRVRRTINRFLYGQRDEPYELLARLAAGTRGIASADELLPELARTIGTALKVPYTRIDLGRRTQRPPVVWGDEPAAVRHLPLIHQGRPVGQLTIGLRAGQRELAAREQELLATVASQAATVAETVVLTEHLLRSREQLIAAREEERRRLRRDLHDDLGPQLTGIALGLDLLAESAQLRGQTDLMASAERLHGELADAIVEIRRLVEDLRPPRLDDAGLVGAIRELAGRAGRSGVRIEVSAPSELPPLPAAVEVAAYRIAAEAMTNVVRHAGASTCSVDLTVGLDDLSLVIEDDGNGGARPGAGNGTTTIMERAEELGGTCAIGPGPAGGSRVAATLPRQHLVAPASTPEPEPVL